MTITCAPVTLLANEAASIPTVLGDEFPWYRAPQQTLNPIDSRVAGRCANTPFFCHTLMRPSTVDGQTGQINSENYKFFYTVFERWMHEQSIAVDRVFRACINLTTYCAAEFSVPHVDHNFPHANWIWYLNTTSAPTLLFDNNLCIERSIPCVANTAVSFSEQTHAQTFPTMLEQRVVVVFTYI